MMIVEELLKPNDVLHGARSSYEILNLIGRGGMGAVYRAQRTIDGSVWALKEMRPPPNTPDEEIAENRTLFEQEADLIGKLDHPNLPALADRFAYEGRPVMVMEYVPGQTLEEQIHDTNAPLMEQQALMYGIQLCRVLHYLHTRTPPIIYRDLKPPNIMNTPEGIMKLIDFGVARTYKARKAKDTIAMGSAGYAPPEQYGKGQTDARSDVYALGATLLHLLTNLPPVPLQTPQPGDIRKHNPSVDTDTEKVIIKAMSLDRNKRYASCAEMEQVLLQCLDAPYIDPTANVAPPPIEPPSPDQLVGAAAPAPDADAPPAHAPWAPAAPQPAAPAAPPPVDMPTAVPHQAPQPTGPTCKHCGYVNKSGARFCAGCGTPLFAAPAARLRIRSPRSTWEMRLDDDIPYRIGRRDPSQSHYPELDLAEHDRGIASRHHATIQRANDTYTLTDLGSTNGTLVNGTRLAAFTPQRLQPGDQIKVGEVEMEFRWA
jgi:hypothetical protein